MNYLTGGPFTTRMISDARDGLEIFLEARGLTGLEVMDRPVVLDIGAHYGVFALEALAAGARSAVCVEAAQSNYGVLLGNVVLNGLLHKVTPLHAAAYETAAATVALRKTSGDNTGQYSVEFDARYEVSDRAVPVLRFTDLLRQRERWDLVKIDIEGGEWSLLTGPDAVPALMERIGFLDLELHPLDNADYYAPRERAHTIAEVIGWFGKHGYVVGTSPAHPTRLFVKGARL